MENAAALREVRGDRAQVQEAFQLRGGVAISEALRAERNR